MVAKNTATRKDRIKIVCLECGKKFSTLATLDVECPKCGGVDIEVDEMG